MNRTLLASDKVVLLLALVPYLREHGPTPITELADTFEVEPKVLRKLITFLGTAGIPGETLSYQHNDLFDIDWHEFETEDIVSLTQTVAIEETPRFTGVETAALLAGLAALQSILGPADAEAAATLAARLGAAMGATPVPAVVVTPEARDHEVARYVRAIERGTPLRFNYRDAAGHVSQRTVEPQSLTEREGVWYLHGFNRERGAMRTFTLAQITDLVELDEPTARPGAGYSAPAGSDTPDGTDDERAPIRPTPGEHTLDALVLLASVPVRLLGAIRGFAPEIVERDGVVAPPGAVLVEIEGWHAGAAVRLVQHGPGEIEVLAPPAARAAVSEWAEAARAAYGE